MGRLLSTALYTFRYRTSGRPALPAPTPFTSSDYPRNDVSRINSDIYNTVILAPKLGSGPVLLKPHGSLNWYEATQVQKVSAHKRLTLFESNKGGRRECVEAFLAPRGIKTKVGRRYNPLIVPPTYLKDFKRPVFQRLWNNCTDVLSTPKKLVFLGYSLPAADLHAHFIFRCGFHNQLKGRLATKDSRHSPTGPAEVIIINPDQDAARRIESVVGPQIPCQWIPKRIEDWLDSGA